jgi:hypothetical protein
MRLGFDPRQRQRYFSSSHCAQICSGAHPASFPVGTRGPFPGTKELPVGDANHSPPSSAEVKNEYDLVGQLSILYASAESYVYEA